jgi:hypothetical protein
MAENKKKPVSNCLECPEFVDSGKPAHAASFCSKKFVRMGIPYYPDNQDWSTEIHRACLLECRHGLPNRRCLDFNDMDNLCGSVSRVAEHEVKCPHDVTTEWECTSFRWDGKTPCPTRVKNVPKQTTKKPAKKKLKAAKPAACHAGPGAGIHPAWQCRACAFINEKYECTSTGLPGKSCVYTITNERDCGTFAEKALLAKKPAGSNNWSLHVDGPEVKAIGTFGGTNGEAVRDAVKGVLDAANNVAPVPAPVPVVKPKEKKFSMRLFP